MTLQLTFLGAGNVATHLAKVFFENGHTINQVYSRTENSAKILAELVNAKYTNDLSEIEPTSDMYFLVVKDSAAKNVLSEINLKNKILVHCSGSLPISVLSGHCQNYGVFYPLQTFSKNRKISFKKIPVFVEANSEYTKQILTDLAKQISENVRILSSEKRKALHISAVFACNFVNHFYAIANEILAKEDISYDVLQSLVNETAKKSFELGPKNAQTGPAIRFDQEIISDHLKQLEKFPDYKKLYNTISKSIFEFHKKQINDVF